MEENIEKELELIEMINNSIEDAQKKLEILEKKLKGE